jgi:hypothetical protein
LEPFISLVNEAKQRGEMTERESTMPLYEMVVELLDGIGARYVSVSFQAYHMINLLIALIEILNTPIISPVMAYLLTQGKRLLILLASATIGSWLLGAAFQSFLLLMVAWLHVISSFRALVEVVYIPTMSRRLEFGH